MNVWLVGCSHHSNDIETLERMVFNHEQTARFLDTFHRSFPCAEAVLLSTCNRTELYVASEIPDNGPDFARLQQLLLADRPLSTSDARTQPADTCQPIWYRYAGSQAVLHLFSVSASLDSMVVGESQIIRQVKQAYSLAAASRGKMKLMHGLFQAAIRAARCVARQTDLQRRPLSIPRLALSQYVSQSHGSLDGRRILIIGAGAMAKETLRSIRELGQSEILIVSRTRQTATALAEQFQAAAFDWSQLLDQLVQTDVAIGVSGASEPIVRESDFADVMSRRGGRSLQIFDWAVPRNFEASIGQFRGVELASIDEFKNRYAGAERRPAGWSHAERIVEESAAAFISATALRGNSSTIARFTAQARQVKERELQRLMNRLNDLDDHHRTEIVAAFHRLTNQLLHRPLESLQRQPVAEQSRLVAAIKLLYQLDDC
jgi:glutamyl-tRNA reductase